MKRRNLKSILFYVLAIAAILTSVFAVNLVSAKSASPQSGCPYYYCVSLSANKVSAPSVSSHTRNLHTLVAEKNALSLGTNPRSTPIMVSKSLAKAKASTNRNAPVVTHLLSQTAAVSPRSTSYLTGFQGMADSGKICPPFGCEPPDMALATSPTLVLQGVNTSYAFYNTSGQLVAGPFTTVNWYGVPAPPKNCDSSPFMSDPRAFYDPNTGLFWTATLQVEGAFGVAPNCPHTSIYWVANINPTTGVMHVYAFDMTLGGKVNATADYTQFGFSGSTIAFSGNMFDNTGSFFNFAEAQFVNKAAMQQGLPVTPTAFTNFAAHNPQDHVQSVLLDTIQPVETETTPINDPGFQYLVNSFNMNGDPFGDNCQNVPCNGLVVWAFNPGTQSIKGTFAPAYTLNPEYEAPPSADEPPNACQCIETLDTRISGTPVYSTSGGNGLLSFSIDTAVDNGSLGNPVPGILWGQILVSSGLPTNLFQAGYLAFSGDQAASFGAMMPDKNGNLFMVFDSMSSKLNPSIMIAEHKASDPLDSIGNVNFILKGPAPYRSFQVGGARWGDYEAASYTGFGSNQVWVASQYSVNYNVDGDWGTFIARVS